jgi:hypothetical protein
VCFINVRASSFSAGVSKKEENRQPSESQQSHARKVLDAYPAQLQAMRDGQPDALTAVQLREYLEACLNIYAVLPSNSR